MFNSEKKLYMRFEQDEKSEIIKGKKFKINETSKGNKSKRMWTFILPITDVYILQITEFLL